MKTALALLVIGLFLGLLAPQFWGESVSIIGVTLPQSAGSKSPPTTFDVSGTTLLRITGGVSVFLAILCFIIFRGGHPDP